MRRVLLSSCAATARASAHVRAVKGLSCTGTSLAERTHPQHGEGAAARIDADYVRAGTSCCAGPRSTRCSLPRHLWSRWARTSPPCCKLCGPRVVRIVRPAVEARARTKSRCIENKNVNWFAPAPFSDARGACIDVRGGRRATLVAGYCRPARTAVNTFSPFTLR